MLELATYKDNMVSTDDYINQTIKVCTAWIPIVKGEEPEGKIIVAFDDPSFGYFSKEAEAAYDEDGVWRFWLSDRVISTHKDGVTHYKKIGKLPKEAKKTQDEGDKQ